MPAPSRPPVPAARAAETRHPPVRARTSPHLFAPRNPLLASTPRRVVAIVSGESGWCSGWGRRCVVCANREEVTAWFELFSGEGECREGQRFVFANCGGPRAFFFFF